VPIHVGALPFAARAVHDFFKGRIRPGDVYLLNDPYRGGNHLPDLTVFVPFSTGRLVFWSINRSHQSDIGGATHGAYNAGATEIYQEGSAHSAPEALRGGSAARRRLRNDRAQVSATRATFAAIWRPMIGSARIGERRLGQLLMNSARGDALPPLQPCSMGPSGKCAPSSPAGRMVPTRGGFPRRRWPRRPRHCHIRARIRKHGSDLDIDLSDSHAQVTGSSIRRTPIPIRLRWLRSPT
jgi:N-methylhydantoinase B